jgi:integrase/recombinase XerC
MRPVVSLNNYLDPVVADSRYWDAKVLLEYRNELIAAGRRVGTVRQRLLHIEHLNRRHRDLLAVTKQDLVNHLADKSKTNGPEGQKAIRASLRSFYTWAHESHLIDANPSATLSPIRIPRVIARIAADSDVQAALITATPQQEAMILLARYGCLRLAELTALESGDRQEDLLHIVGKGGKHRLVPANDALLRSLLRLEREQGSGPYFPGRYGRTMHPTAVGKIIRRVTGWNPHSLRHAGATAAYNSTRDIRAVQELLGHASLATTERYLHTSLDRVRIVAAATSLPTGIPLAVEAA